MKKQFLTFLRCEDGATAIEYALIAGIVSICIATSISSLSTSLQNMFTSVHDAFAANGQ
jgi:pilus assembly protein Flp/PilA